MDITKMTILTWHDGTESAQEGVLALMKVRNYESFDYFGYKPEEEGREITHTPAETITAIGISLGNGGWDIHDLSHYDDGMIFEVGQDCDYARVLKWAELPLIKSDIFEPDARFLDEDADMVAEKLKDIPFGGASKKSKFILS